MASRYPPGSGSGNSPTSGPGIVKNKFGQDAAVDDLVADPFGTTLLGVPVAVWVAAGAYYWFYVRQ